MSESRQVTPPQDAFCLGCGYALRELPGRRCPECGRPFDPADGRTMSRVRPLRLWQVWLLQPMGWRTIALALLGTACLAWLSRWPRLTPEPLPVLASEFRWPAPYTMPPTLPDVVWYAAVGMWALFLTLALLWQAAPLLLVPRVARRANVWDLDTRRRRRAILIAAGVAVFCLVFGWQQRVGRRWIARMMAPNPRWARVRGRGTMAFDAAWDPWRHSPVTLSPGQERDALAHLIVRFPDGAARLPAIRLLVEGAGRAALPSLVHAAESKSDENLLAWELRLIGLCRDPDTASLLIGHLQDPRPAVRAAAADATGILRLPSYSIYVPDGFYIADPLALDTQPPINVGGIIAGARSSRSWNFNGGWSEHELRDDPPVAMDASVRRTLEGMMLRGASADEREAAARTLAAWPPDRFRFRVAEWGVWVNAQGHLALSQSVLDEIPPFVHRMGNPVATFGEYILYPSQVAKPIVHLTSDVPLSADVEVQIKEGRPWFAYPKPDDFGVGVLRDQRTSRPLGNVAGSGRMRTGPVPTGPADDFAVPPIASMPDCREGYPWLSRHHRLYPESGMGTAPIFRLGVRWQSLVVSPARLPWMRPPAAPRDDRFRWWERLRDVPSCWVGNRGEAERFLYYDGPTRSAVPVAVTLEDAGRRLRVAIARDDPPTYRVPDSVHNVFRGMPPPAARPDLPEHDGLYIDVHNGRVRAQFLEDLCDGSTSIDLDPALTGEAAVAGKLREMLVRYGLTGPEADGLIAAWAAQFFRAEGRRCILRMSPAEYARQCPMQVRPTPTEVVRLGLVLTEFDAPPAPPTTLPAVR